MAMNDKWAFMVLNAVLWVVGLGSVVLGVWSYVRKQHADIDLIPSSYGTLSAVGLCIAAGLTVIIITFVGCLGVSIGSRLLLISYIFFVTLLLTVQLVVSVLALKYQPEIYEHVRTDMEHSMKYHREVFSTSRLTWDQLQALFHCCGVNGPLDWFGSQKWPNSSYVPDSCCDKSYFNPNASLENCGKGKENWNLWFHQGCSQVYTDWLFEEIKVAAYIAIVFICIELLLLMLAILIFRSVRKNRMSYKCSRGPYHYTKGTVAGAGQKKPTTAVSVG